ncbi:MAG: methyltransferase [Rikenellaceae bacterium]
MFRFKQFTIKQDRTAMKVGTDGVLLGAWASSSGNEESILDIGSGTGLIAIMMAQRSSAPRIVGVEIDSESAAQAAENMELSPWDERLTVEHTSILDYSPQHKFDLILSNPPYFVDSLLPKGESRTRARHTTELDFEGLTESVVRLLKPVGKFALILPTNESQIFDRTSEGRLYLERRCWVRGKVGGDVKRILSQYSLTKPDTVAESELSIRDGSADGYHPDYRALTSEFYLKF